MPKLTEAEEIAKLRRLVGEIQDSEDPDACPDCRDGKHMDCIYEVKGEHDSAGCACEFCCA